MSYTAGFSVNVGDPTKASDVTTLAANDDYLKAAVDGKAALSGSTNNTVATVTGANALIGEADLTFASNKLTVFGTTGTGTATAGVLNLSTRETTVVDADQLGRIDFQAPAETGADAILVTASIYAEADVTFDATNNATDIVFATAHDGAAAERLRITSQGEIGLAGANYGNDGQVLTSAGAGAAAAWETIPPGTTLSGTTDNTVATVTGANALQGEANLTFDGSTLTVTGDQHIADGNGLIIGHTSGVAPEGVTGEFQMLGTGNADTFASITRFQASADGPAFFLSKSRHGTIGSSAIVQDGDSLGYMAWCGDDGNDLINIGAAIRSNVDGTPGNNNIPGRLTFHTATGGSLSERMKIAANGDVNIASLFQCNVSTTGVSIGTTTTPVSTVTKIGANGGDVINITGSNGRVGIGTASPARILDLTTATDISGIRSVNTNGTFSNTTFDASIDRASNSAYAFIYGHNNSQGDIQFNIRGDGNALLDETWQDNSIDYAEYFENTGTAIEVGATVVLDGGKVRAFNADTDSADDIIGVNRPKIAMSGPSVHGSQWNRWHNKYLVDDYGRHIFVETTCWAWEQIDAVLYEEGDELPEGAEIGDIKTPAREAGLAYEHYELIKDSTWTPHADATSSTDTIRKMNAEYDESVTYESREERDEWSLIGLVGQVPMTKGETTNSRWIKMGDVSDAVERWMIR